MRGSTAGVAAAVLLAVLLVGAPRGQGTSFNPLTADECPAPLFTPGAKVALFHSGTEETRHAVRAGDVLVVSRALPDGRREAVGRIRVDAAAGALCFRGEVLEGELRPHDVALAGSVSLLLIPTDASCLYEPAR